MRARLRTATITAVVVLLLATATPAAAQLYELAPPTDLRVTALDHTSATIAWDASPDATHYSVVWSTPVGWADVDGTSITIPIQFPGARHHVSVRAMGESDVSVSVGLSFTAPKAPPPPVPPTPEDVEVTAAPGTLTVAWEPSLVDGVEAETYVVRLRPGHTGIVTSDTSLTHVTPPGGDFHVTVSARNGFFSTSEPSAPIDVTVPPAPDWEPLTQPGPPQLVVEDGVVTRIEWEPSQGGAEPVVYQLDYRFADDPWEAWIARNDEPFIDVASQIGVLFVCDEGSAPGQTWVIWVTAHSHGTTSPRSAEATVCIG